MSKEGVYDNVKLISDGKIFKIYQVFFPHTSAQQVVLAFTDVELKRETSYVFDSLIQWKVEQVEDVISWVRMIAIRKALCRLGISQTVKSKQLSSIDGIVCSHQIGLTAREHLLPLSENHLKESKQMIKRQVRSMLADYHSENVILGSGKGIQLGWREGEGAILRISEGAWVARYDEGHWQWIQQGYDPYSRDRVALQHLLDSFSSVENKTSLIEHQLMDHLLQKIRLLISLRECPYLEFKQTYLTVKKQPFIIEQHKQLADNIREYYQRTCRKTDLKAFLEQRLEEAKEKASRSWQSMREAEELLTYLMFLQTPNISSFSKTDHFKTTELSYFHYYANRIGTTLDKGQMSLSDLSAKINKTNQNEVLLWHFLRAKIESKNGKYYRALSHLKQAEKMSKDKSTLGVLALEKGRNWELLSLNQKAKQFYTESEQLKKDFYGSIHPFVLIPLYNLLQLAIKQNEDKKMAALRNEIEDIKKKWSKEQMFQWSRSRLLWTVDQSDRDKEQRKIGSKDMFIKIQSSRMPIVEQLWNYSKQLLQKGKPTKTEEKSCFVQTCFSQACGSASILLVIDAIIHPNNQMPMTLLSRLEYILNILKSSNVKNYNRLLYSLSFTWEHQKQYSKAIHAMHLIDSTSPSLYSLAVQMSIKRRILHLSKISDQKQYLLKFYLQHDMDKWGDMEELFQCLQVLEEQGEEAKCMRLARHYLAHIHEYPTTPEENPMKGKFVDHSFSVKVILVRVYLQLRHYKEATEIIKELQEKGTKIQEVGNLLLMLLESAVTGQEWIIGWWALQELLGRKLEEKSTQQENRYKVVSFEKVKLWKCLIKVAVGMRFQDISSIQEWLKSNVPQGETWPIATTIAGWKDLQLLFQPRSEHTDG